MAKITTFVFLIIVLNACTSIKKGVEHSSKKTYVDNLSTKERVRFDKVFYAANKAKVLGNFDEAASLFSQCVRKDPSNAASIYELSNIYLQMGKLKESLFFAKKAASISPDNIWYQLALAENYKQNRIFDKSIKVYGNIVKNHPENINAHYEMAGIMVRAGNLNNAINEYNKIEKKIGVVEDVIIQKELIYINLNKIDKAVGELNKLIESNPEEPRYYGMLAELYQANGFNDKAMDIFQKMLLLDPDNSQVHLALANFYRTQGKKDLYFNELEIAFKSKAMDIDQKIEILFTFFSLSESSNEITDYALKLCETLVKIHPNEAKAHAIYGDYLYREGEINKSFDVFKTVLKIDKSRFLVWRQVLQIESELKKFEAMQKDSKEAIELFPNQAILYLYNGIANIQKKSFDVAIEMLNKGVELTSDNKYLLASFYSNLGDSYHSKKDTGASDQSYDKALEYDPDNIYVLNNYSYYLSLRGKNLEKARKMSFKTIELNPDNTSFQDTYGWILYMSGNYNEAKFWIEKALKNGGNLRPIILEHYGDILFKLEQEEDALFYWKDARSKGGGSKMLDIKILNKKLYENP